MEKGKTMKTFEFTAAHERLLRDQVISSDKPGSVLHDFDAILDFVGPYGVPAKGQHNLLPLKSIGEMDRLLSRPLNLQMKRPLIRSHPYLLGLNLLLRASGLTLVEGSGDKARLVVDPEMMLQWKQLNPTERYFNLLEAWLLFGRAEMVGEDGGFRESFFNKSMQCWTALPEDGKRFDLDKPQENVLPGLYREFYVLALMDLFGLVEVEYPDRPVMPWCPAAVRHRFFGDAMCALMAIRLHSPWSIFVSRQVAADEEDEELGEQDEEEGEEQEDEEDGMPQFGPWQPIFQPYFPEWRQIWCSRSRSRARARSCSRSPWGRSGG
jgi:hypothetical protein